MDIKDILKKSPLFSALAERDLNAVAKISTTKSYAKGEAIFNEGEPADRLFILNSGRIEVFKLSAEGKRQILRIVLPGEVFAEAAMFSGETYPAYADAASDCELLSIAQEEFLELLKRNPELSLRMLGALSKLLRGFTGMIEDLCLRDVPSRLAKFFLDRSIKVDRDFFQLDMKMGDLAQKICTVNETLSRTLRKMRVKEVIDVKGKTITILNKEALQKIASGMKL